MGFLKEKDDIFLLGKQLPDSDGVREVSQHLGEKAAGSIFAGVLAFGGPGLVMWPGLRSASHPRFTFPLAPASSAQRMQLHCKESPGGNLASLSALDCLLLYVSGLALPF